MTSVSIPEPISELQMNVLQLLMDNARDHAIVLMDAERRVTVWNRGAEHLLGWSEHEVLGQVADIFFIPEDRVKDDPEREADQARQQGRAENERWHVRRDGSRFWGSGLMYPLNPQGRTGYVKIFRDRTREHEEQQKLADTTRLLTAILDQLPDPIYLKDRQGVFQVGNRALADLIGVPMDQVLGRDDAAFFSPEAAAAFRQNDLAIMDTGHAQEVEEIVPAGSEPRTYLSTKTPFTDAQGQVIGLLGLSRDVTEHKRVETALRERDTRLSIATEAAAMGLFTWDMAEGRGYFENDRMYALIGRNPAQGPINREEFLRDFLHPDDAESLIRTIAASAQSGRNFAAVCRVRRADGRILVIQFSGRFEFAPDGSPVRMVGAALDVTDAAEYRQELEERQQQIEDLNTRLRRAMQETHHRVKNNLQVIAALVEIQDEAGDDPALQRIKRHARALAVIHDMLTLQVKDDAEVSQVSIKSVLERLLPTLQDVSGGRTITADLEELRMPLQKAAALTLLVNECVSNAIKHSKGNVSITFTCEQGMAQLEICDDGSGFPPDFNPRKSANTGLELIDSAARWDLRGQVRYENNSDGGGRVVVTFPAEA